MTSHRARPPLAIQPGVSPSLAVGVISTHVLAALALASLPLGAVQLLVLIAIGASALYVLVVDVLRRAPWSIRSATWQADGAWLIRFVSGAEREASLAPATFVTRPLILLVFRLGPLRRASLPIPADALDPELMRRLRQGLRIETPGDAREPSP